MNLLDLFLGALAVSAAMGGYRLGLIARVASWAGALAGLLVAIWGLPSLLREVEVSPIGGLFLIVAVLLMAAAVGGALGELLGHQLRRAVPPGPARVVDRSLGAVGGVAGLAVAVWLLLPVAADVPGAVAELARGSRVLQTIQDVAPRPPDTVQALRTLVGDQRFPQVFDDLRRAPDTGPPPEAVPVPADVVARARASTVNVEATGCGGIHEGSGFTIAADTVVTNAHVVAGADRIRLRRPDQRVVDAEIVAFDDNRDLAVLRAPGLRQSPLPVAGATEGQQGAVIGYPGGQNVPRVAPAAVTGIRPTVGRDIYGRDRVERRVLFLAAALRQGDSGSALIDASGRVIGVAFAIAPDRPATAFALDQSELQAVLRLPRQPGAGGPCI